MNKTSIIFATAASLALASCGASEEESDMAVVEDTAMADQMANSDTAQSGSIVEVAQSNADLSTLLSAVQSAGLVDTLSAGEPYTVFAPTNAAFEGIPQATRDQLMSSAGQSDLASILTYHVVEGETMAPALISAIQAAGEGGYTLETVNGATLTAMLDGENVVLRDAAGNTATVVQTDVDASNGVVHVIDGVLMPE
jgi:uncharacterized surface protein with fasciclin (FAS1) repeats